jgi:hypothetical protein
MDLQEVEWEQGLEWSGSEYGQVTGFYGSGFYKMRGIAWLTDDLLGSYGGLSSSELVY